MDVTNEVSTPVELIDEESCGFDLYTDIVTNDIQTQFEQLKEDHEVCKNQLEVASRENKQFKTENKAYAEENEVLRKNISLLYLTAKNEVERKDYEIDRLRKKLQYAQSKIQELGMAQLQGNIGSKDKMGISNRLMTLAHQARKPDMDSTPRAENSAQNDVVYGNEPVQYNTVSGASDRDQLSWDGVSQMYSQQSYNQYYTDQGYGVHTNTASKSIAEPTCQSDTVTCAAVNHEVYTHHKGSSSTRESGHKPGSSDKPAKKSDSVPLKLSKPSHDRAPRSSRSRSHSTGSGGSNTVSHHEEKSSVSKSETKYKTRTSEVSRKRSRSGSVEVSSMKADRGEKHAKQRRTETQRTTGKKDHVRENSVTQQENGKTAVEVNKHHKVTEKSSGKGHKQNHRKETLKKEKDIEKGKLVKSELSGKLRRQSGNQASVDSGKENRSKLESRETLEMNESLPSGLDSKETKLSKTKRRSSGTTKTRSTKRLSSSVKEQIQTKESHVTKKVKSRRSSGKKQGSKTEVKKADVQDKDTEKKEEISLTSQDCQENQVSESKSIDERGSDDQELSTEDQGGEGYAEKKREVKHCHQESVQTCSDNSKEAESSGEIVPKEKQPTKSSRQKPGKEKKAKSVDTREKASSNSKNHRMNKSNTVSVESQKVDQTTVKKRRRSSFEDKGGKKRKKSGNDKSKIEARKRKSKDKPGVRTEAVPAGINHKDASDTTVADSEENGQESALTSADQDEIVTVSKMNDKISVDTSKLEAVTDDALNLDNNNGQQNGPTSQLNHDTEPSGNPRETDDQEFDGRSETCGVQENDECQVKVQANVEASCNQPGLTTETIVETTVHEHMHEKRMCDEPLQSNQENEQSLETVGSDSEIDSSFGDQAPPTPGSCTSHIGNNEEPTPCQSRDIEEGIVPDSSLNVGNYPEAETDGGNVQSVTETEYELSEGEILSSDSEDEKEKEKTIDVKVVQKTREVNSSSYKRREEVRQSRRTSENSRKDLRSIIEKSRQSEQRRELGSRRDRNKTDTMGRTSSRDRDRQPSGRNSLGDPRSHQDRHRNRERSAAGIKDLASHERDFRDRHKTSMRTGSIASTPRNDSDRRDHRNPMKSSRPQPSSHNRDKLPSRRDSRHHRS